MARHLAAAPYNTCNLSPLGMQPMQLSTTHHLLLQRNLQRGSSSWEHQRTSSYVVHGKSTATRTACCTLGRICALDPNYGFSESTAYNGTLRNNRPSTTYVSYQRNLLPTPETPFLDRNSSLSFHWCTEGGIVNISGTPPVPHTQTDILVFSSENTTVLHI